MEPSTTRAPEPIDLLLAGGIVVTMDARHTVFNPGALAVRGNAIIAVGPRDQVAAAYRAPRTLDASDALVMPGLVNGHTHLPMTMFRGLADDLPLDTWLQEYILAL